MRDPSPLVIAACSCMAVVLGCSAAPIEVDAFCAELASIRCRAALDCGCDGPIRSMSQLECQRRVAEGCPLPIFLPEANFVEGVERGELSWDAARAGAFLERLRDARCDPEAALRGRTLREIGTLFGSLGGGAALGAECDNYGIVGAGCEEGVCELLTRRCVPELREGDACDDRVGRNTCAFRYDARSISCVAGDAGAGATCRIPGGSGEPCGHDTHCDASDGLQCLDGRCGHEGVALGQPCGRDSECASRYCAAGACEAATSDGAACDASTRCERGSTCIIAPGDDAGRCGAPRVGGELCGSEDTCREGASCVGGRCLAAAVCDIGL